MDVMIASNTQLKSQLHVETIRSSQKFDCSDYFKLRQYGRQYCLHWPLIQVGIILKCLRLAQFILTGCEHVLRELQGNMVSNKDNVVQIEKKPNMRCSDPLIDLSGSAYWYCQSHCLASEHQLEV